MSVYDTKPDRFLQRLIYEESSNPAQNSSCAGFELKMWRSAQFASHLIEWLPEYALPEDELSVTHANMYVKLKQAAVRVYTSSKYANRGEAGEIALHAICRDQFDTIPISPRVFYKSASNDVVKAFDLVHARFPKGATKPELWLGESKFYASGSSAIADAVKSVRAHLDQGFLTNQKLLLGPQIPKSIPQYEKLLHLFNPQTSLDDFISSAVFVVGVLCNSPAAANAQEADETYKVGVKSELVALAESLTKSGLTAQIKILLVYVPLADKKSLIAQFDKKLKGLQ